MSEGYEMYISIYFYLRGISNRIYHIPFEKTQNYISPVAKDSIEMQTAELLAGSDGAFVYKFITTDKYKKLKLHIYRYESGKLSDHDKVEM